jgi:hypothetical protein
LEGPGIENSDIKGDLKGIRWEGVNWVHLAQDRGKWRAVVNMVMNLWAVLHAADSLLGKADISGIVFSLLDLSG